MNILIQKRQDYTYCLGLRTIGELPSFRGRPGPRFGGVVRKTDAVPAVATPPGICGTYWAEAVEAGVWVVDVGGVPAAPDGSEGGAVDDEESSPAGSGGATEEGADDRAGLVTAESGSVAVDSESVCDSAPGFESVASIRSGAVALGGGGGSSDTMGRGCSSTGGLSISGSGGGGGGGGWAGGSSGSLVSGGGGFSTTVVFSVVLVPDVSDPTSVLGRGPGCSPVPSAGCWLSAVVSVWRICC